MTLRARGLSGLVAGAAALALAVAGCAPTVAELRAGAPEQTWESPQPPAAVIGCVRDAVDAAPRSTPPSGVLLRLDTRPDGTERLLGTIPGGSNFPPTPVFDVLAAPHGRGSLISLRAYALWPGHVRPIVTRCAGA